MKVFISGPYTRGDVAVNVRNAILAADAVLALGHVPFIPHLNHLWHTVSPKEYEVWMAWDLAWLEQCDVLVRLPGDSLGADREVEHAFMCGIPVFSLEELKQHAGV